MHKKISEYIDEMNSEVSPVEKCRTPTYSGSVTVYKYNSVVV